MVSYIGLSIPCETLVTANVLVAVVIHAGAGWHTQSARALIAGQGARPKAIGRGVHYLHISGTSSISDRPHTQGYTETRTFSDEEDIYAYEKYRESFEVWSHRTTDITVVESGEEFGVSTYIVMAPTIFGLGTGPFNRYSIQLPSMITAALSTGRTIVLGDGKTVWSHIHIEDLAALFLSMLENVSLGNTIPNGRKGIYFAETGMHTHLEFSQNLARAGYKMGLLESPEVDAASLEEVGRQWLPEMASMAEFAFGSKYSIQNPATNWTARTDTHAVHEQRLSLGGRLAGSHLTAMSGREPLSSRSMPSGPTLLVRETFRNFSRRKSKSCRACFTGM